MAAPSEGIENLPAWVQVCATIFILIAGGGFAVFGYVKKGLEAFSPHQHQDGDTVVLSGSFADGKPVAALTKAVEELSTDTAERSAANLEALKDLCQAQDRTTAAVDRHTAASDRVETAIRDLCRAYERSLRP